MFGLVIKRKSSIKRLKSQSGEKSKIIKKLRASLSSSVNELQKLRASHSTALKELRATHALQVKKLRQDYWTTVTKLNQATDSNLAIALDEKDSVPDALRSVIDKLLARGRRTAARSIGNALKNNPLSEDMGNFALGVFMHREAILPDGACVFQCAWARNCACNCASRIC